MKKTGLLYLLMFMLCGNVFCSVNIDSLEQLLSKASSDTAKIKLLNKLALEHSNSGSQEIARIKAKAAFDLALKAKSAHYLVESYNTSGLIEYNAENNFEALRLFNLAIGICKENELISLEAITENNIGNTYYFMGEYLNATRSYKTSIELFESAKEKDRSTEPLDMLATCYYQQSDFGSALQTHIRSLQVKEAYKNEKAYTFSYLGIGNIYYQKKDYLNALKNYLTSLEYAQKNKQDYEIGRAYNNIGRVYIDLGKPDLANEYNLLGLEAKERNDPSDPEIINSLENISSYYQKKEKYDSALYFIDRALIQSRKSGAEINIAESLTNLAIILNKTGRTNDAIDSLQLALSLARKNLSLVTIRPIFEELAQCYFKNENYKMAFTFQRQFSEVSDSILNEENTRSMNEIMVKFDTEKKEKEILELNLQKKIQTIITVSVASGLIILLLLSFVLLRSFRATKKAKILVEEQKNIVEEKNVEITASIVYAQRIQQAILPDPALLNSVLPEHFIIYKPKDIVSGDFYWLAEFAEYYFFAIADCTGHGVPGSLMSMMGVNLLNQITANNHSKSPNEILTELDYQLKKALHLSEQKAEKTADGMDIALIKMNRNNNRVEYAGANRSIITLSNGILSEIKATKKPIGGDNEMSLFAFNGHALHLNSGDMIYLSSDGYADQFGGPTGKKKMTTSRLKTKLTELSYANVTLQKNILVEYFEEWKGDNEQIDDILLAGIRMK